MNEPTSPPAIVPPFAFSQSSLRDFDRCPRLFLLRYVEGLEWPATAASRRWELNLRTRRRFHRLLHQQYVGVDVDATIAAEPADSPIPAWWEAFQHYPPALPDGETYPEVSLSAPIGAHRLVARFDLLTVAPPEHAVITDWKTGRLPASPHELRDQWQTIVYQYLLAVAGAPFFAGAPPLPESITMVYWFADYAASPLIMEYDRQHHEEASRRLSEKIAEIARLPASEFLSCDDERICNYCAFQSYCKRGRELGDIVDELLPEEEEWDIFDVPEYEY